MVTNFIRARNVLERRLDAVFNPETFDVLYPEAEQAPKTFVGFPTSEPPFYAAVDEVIDTASTAGASTIGQDTVTFTINVWLCAQHTRLSVAADTLLCYIDALFASIMADPSLNGTVENSFPRLESSGTAADSSKRHIAAAVVAIECQVWTGCHPLIAVAVESSNQALA